MRRLVLTACLAAVALVAPAQASVAWPYRTLQLGLHSGENGGADARSIAPFGLRYQYLSGGVNTARPWQAWGRGGGSFVSDYIADSQANGATPVFSYYELRQSNPGAAQSDEAAGLVQNLADPKLMRTYFEDLEVFFRRAAAAGGTVVLHVEPDLWGYVERRGSDDATKVPAMVASSGMPDLKGLPDNAAGLAKAIVQLRDNYAPNVLLGYHVSTWGTGKDIAVSNEADAAIDALADRSAAFYRSLGAKFDAVFAEYADRDSGYAESRNGAQHDSAWWDDADFARHVRFLGDLHAALKLPLVLWQIPLGTTLPGSKFGDNRSQWLLDGSPAATHRARYANVGVVALLFGAGQGDATNERSDGGFFTRAAAAYYAGGATRLPAVTRTPRRSARPSTSPGRAAGFSTRARARPAAARPGTRVDIRASARTAGRQTALLDVEVYDAAGRKVYQRYFDHQAFRAGRVRTFAARWTVPSDAPAGDYSVRIGVFAPDFGALRHWNASAARVRVIR